MKMEFRVNTMFNERNTYRWNDKEEEKHIRVQYFVCVE